MRLEYLLLSLPVAVEAAGRPFRIPRFQPQEANEAPTPTTIQLPHLARQEGSPVLTQTLDPLVDESPAQEYATTLPPGASTSEIDDPAITTPTFTPVTSYGDLGPSVVPVPVIIPYEGKPFACFNCIATYPPNVEISTPEFCVKLIGASIDSCPEEDNGTPDPSNGNVDDVGGGTSSKLINASPNDATPTDDDSDDTTPTSDYEAGTCTAHITEYGDTEGFMAKIEILDNAGNFLADNSEALGGFDGTYKTFDPMEWNNYYWIYCAPLGRNITFDFVQYVPASMERRRSVQRRHNGYWAFTGWDVIVQVEGTRWDLDSTGEGLPDVIQGNWNYDGSEEFMPANIIPAREMDFRWEC